MTEAMREQFEAALQAGVCRSRRSDGLYWDEAAEIAWRSYQAALRSPAVAGLVEAAKDAADALDEVGKAAVWPLREAIAKYATLAGEKA